MKDSKFWVWFVPLFIVVCVGLYFMIDKNINRNRVPVNTDAQAIKEEYARGNEDYYMVSLGSSNVYKFIKSKDLKELNEGLVFVGDASNNVVRKSILILNDVVSSTSVPQVYYIDIKDFDDDLVDFFEEEKEVSNIKAGTLISLQDKEILKIYYPNNVLDNKELSEEEKNSLYNIYREIVDNFIEECDEDC